MKLIYLSTCVWGPWHLDVLARVLWPNILADGNLPDLVSKCRAVYRICTTKRDQAKMRQMPVFDKIAALVEIEFIDTPNEDPEPIFHMHHFVSELHAARDANAIFFNLWPDVVFTENTIGHAADTILAGKAGCTLPTVRVVAETCIEDTIKRFAGPAGSAMAISPGDVVDLAVKHLHPLSITSIDGAVHGRPDTCIIYRVPGEGLVSRSSNTWLYIDPSRFEFSENLAFITSDPNPGQMIHVVADSDDMLVLSIAPLFKEHEVFRPFHSSSPTDIARMTMHPWLAVCPLFDPIDEVCTRLHYGKMTEELWAPVVRRSEEDFDKVRMMRAYMRIWTLLKENGCEDVSRIMGMALIGLGLPGSWLIDEPVTIFVPNNEAIAGLSKERRTRLLDRRHAREILGAMLSHTVIGDAISPDQDEIRCTSVTGTNIQVTRDGDGYLVNGDVRVVSDLQSGLHRVLITDKCLDPTPVMI